MIKKPIEYAQEIPELLYKAVLKQYQVHETHRISRIAGFSTPAMINDINITGHKISIGLVIENHIPVFLLFSHDVPEEAKSKPNKKYRCPIIMRVYGGRLNMVGHQLGKGIIKKFHNSLFVIQKELKIKSPLSFELAAIGTIYVALHELIKDRNIGMQPKSLSKQEVLQMKSLEFPEQIVY